jgi:hypothetical protein
MSRREILNLRFLLQVVFDGHVAVFKKRSPDYLPELPGPSGPHPKSSKPGFLRGDS